MASQHPIHFQHPPLVETVLGVQFVPVPNFRNAHLGAFWKRLGPDWPTTTDGPPLPQLIETFGDAEAWAFPAFQLAIASSMPVRMQIRSKDDSRMVQVQNGRLHYNWLGRPGGEYPRYKKVRPEFDTMLSEFQRFLADEKLGEMRPNQWEVAYVNRIPRGTVWNEPADWAKLFRSLVLMRLRPVVRPAGDFRRRMALRDPSPTGPPACASPTRPASDRCGPRGPYSEADCSRPDQQRRQKGWQFGR